MLFRSFLDEISPKEHERKQEKSSQIEFKQATDYLHVVQQNAVTLEWFDLYAVVCLFVCFRLMCLL